MDEQKVLPAVPGAPLVGQLGVAGAHLRQDAPWMVVGVAIGCLQVLVSALRQTRADLGAGKHASLLGT